MSVRKSDALRDLEAATNELHRRRMVNRSAYYQPYTKQAEFHAHGADKRERMFSAANQSGKTYAGAMEAAFHLTGRYPDWWAGRRYERPVRAWAAGMTSESVRDTCQRLLLGTTKPWGTGAIPEDSIVVASSARGVADTVDTVQVKHVSGSVSTIGFKSYERGREKWQGETLDFIWFDEEPPSDIYSEGLARITARRGMVFCTSTPLMGMTTLVGRFFGETHEQRALVRMELSEAEHMTAEDIDAVTEGYAAHERDARLRGLPMLGSGRVFPVADEVLIVKPFELPAYWPMIAALDIGWDHPTAAAWLAWDRDADVVYVTDEYRQKQETVSTHATALRARGAGIPVAWPHDGHSHDKSSGKPIATLYKDQGLAMLDDHAQFPDGSTSVEASVALILDRMRSGRLKIFGTCSMLLDEIHMYHRKDGRIVKERDDLISAVRYGIMELRNARTVDSRGGRRRRKSKIASGAGEFEFS